MNEIKIEKNVPVPARTVKSKYPFAQMEVGDSFFITGVRRNGIYTQASVYAKKDGSKKKFVTREADGGVRCWRVE